MRRILPLLFALSLMTVTLVHAAPGTSALDASKLDADTLTELRDGDAEPVNVLVRVTPDADARAGHVEALGVEVRYAYDAIPTLALTASDAEVRALSLQPWVVHVHHDDVMRTQMDVSRVEVQAHNAGAEGITGQGVNVAVVDTGIDKTHPAFEDRIVGCVKIEAGVTYPVCDDDNGHGTHVSGTVAAAPTATAPGIQGVAPDAGIVAVKVLNSLGVGLTSDVMAGMQWVIDHRDTHDIRVMSMSIGGTECGDGTSDAEQMADAVMDAGIVAVIAAGNSGPSECTVSSPGSAEKVVTVGAVDDFATKNHGDDHVADFSSRGPTKDGRIKPDVVAPGVDITSTFLAGSYATLDGTSMATPHVSGVVALMLEQDPSLTPQQVKDALHSTGIELASEDDAFPNNDVGWGFVNTCDLLTLSDCSQPASLTPVHSAGLALAWEHYGKTGHRVGTTVTVQDDAGSAVGGANVDVDTTAPDGTVHEDSGKTGSSGEVTLTAQQKENGHGTWDSCVGSIWGAGLVYDAAANAETCDSITVSH